MMTSHILWKNKIHVPNHQPENEGSECDTAKVTSGAGGVSDYGAGVFGPLRNGFWADDTSIHCSRQIPKGSFRMKAH